MIDLVKKKILLLTSPAPPKDLSPFYLEEKLMPLGIGFLGASLRLSGHIVDFVDLYLENQKIPDFSDYDFVAISSNTVCFRGTIELINEGRLARKRGWKGKLIVGGPHTTVATETIPEDVDFVILGEGEEVIIDVVEGRIHDRIIRAKRIENLDSLPFPAYDLFDNKKYCLTTKLIPSAKNVFSYSSSRGCPFSCSFCSSKNIWGKKYTFFTPERIVLDLKKLVCDFGADGIYFREDNFTVNKKRVEKLCEYLKKDKDIHALKWATESRVDILSKSILEEMYSAGCTGLYLGIEAGNQKMLDFFQKGISVDQIKDVFSYTKKLGIITYASFIIDTPFEEFQDRIDLFNLIKEIHPDYVGLNHFTGLPGSELYDYSIQNKSYLKVDDIGLLIMQNKNFPHTLKRTPRETIHKICKKIFLR